MKKLLLGAFLLVSALSFSAGRKVPAGKIVMDQTTGIAYVQGEQTPFTGTVEVKFDNGNIEYEKYVSNNGRLVYEKHFYPNGQIDFEATYKDEQLDGIVKKYGPNGQVAQQGIFKDGVQVQ